MHSIILRIVVPRTGVFYLLVVGVRGTRVPCNASTTNRVRCKDAQHAVLHKRGENK